MKIIKILADYHCYPLWDMPPGMYGDINPENLPISRELKEMLFKWALDFDLTLNNEDPSASGFKSREEEEDFNRRGKVMANRLQLELGGDFKVITNWKNI
ncbi:hypothetical protein [Pandoraea vervacti]|uniref:hypothetical protein n=1 Tax=Pandoraea vervacti TaxID=656178 RepID=UPI0009331CCC|nr:hypothetical protein [Pandoraea vervacti]